MKKLPWNPDKDVIRVPAYNLGIDIDRAICAVTAIDYSRQSMEQAKKNDIVKFGMCSVSIRKVIFNDPATIVLWSDGTKTVVKCGPEDAFDMEKGLAMAIVKKMAGNDNRFHKVFKQYSNKKKKEPGSVGSISDMMAGLNQAAAIASKTVHELAHMAAAKAERGE
jgi:hypothetical protein